MNRRLFLHFPLVAAAMTAGVQQAEARTDGAKKAGAGGEAPEPGAAAGAGGDEAPESGAGAVRGGAKRSPPKDPPKRGFKVGKGKDRNQDALLILGGQFDCKVSSKDTNGALLIYDTLREEKGGPALHFHYEQDEWFYVLSGEFMVKVGDDLLHLKAGDTAFAPRQVPHAFAKISDGPAQMMVLFQPAGSMEDFFKKTRELGKAIPKDQEKSLKQLMKDHGMELVGPPLKF